MSKYNNKKPKFKSGDTVENTRDGGLVLLKERWDNNRVPEVSWLVKSYDFPDADAFALREEYMKKES